MKMNFCDLSEISLEFKSDNDADKILLRELYLKMKSMNGSAKFDFLKQLVDGD